ncbi:MAG: 3-hydroxyacyl-ACP dehydratase FabZ [Desulfobacterales bacterium]|jgi:beta-hydroxyacyl-ACP dehydratase FabZ|nr:3-hydroxyacyl-ACP dehydratase FabZ [Desulfobacteraceae bacterium]MDD3992659.1 3-hydroxyacyl-ACP dehydratase FabZ [Desulfobacteraceae bacterium]MDY0312800.1 3-hydroxyacyl-ACP dehydratase FabZ [Desulfobacterales bacterium]
MSDPVYDIRQIMAIMPHRYPFMLVDRVLELEVGRRIRALKNVTIDEPFFRGHFPGMPVMPGVIILEAMGQTGGLLVLASQQPAENELLYFTGMDRVRFRRPVVPGDQLILDVHFLNLRTRAAKIAATATVEGQLAAEAELMATFGEKP